MVVNLSYVHGCWYWYWDAGWYHTLGRDMFMSDKGFPYMDAFRSGKLKATEDSVDVSRLQLELSKQQTANKFLEESYERQMDEMVAMHQRKLRNLRRKILKELRDRKIKLQE